MRTRTWPSLALVVLAGALFGGVVSVAAAAKAPPRSELRANGQRERLAPWTWSWTYREGPTSGCAAVVADGGPSYEPVVSVAHRHARPRIVLRRDRRPRVVRFRAYSQLDAQGYPVGHGRRVNSRLRPKRSGGEIVAWALRFRVDVAERPYFDARLRWPGRGRCRSGGEASYSFGIARE